MGFFQAATATVTGAVREAASRAFRWSSEDYDAIKSEGRRRGPKTKTLHEDKHLKERGRRRMIATSRDIHRNFAIAQWAIRKHLDYVSSFSFQAKTGDSKLDDSIEAFIRGWSNRYRCDVASRHPLRRLIRLCEARAVCDGDFLFLKLAPPPGNPLRGKIQGIEGDRVCTPENGRPNGFSEAEWVNGVRVDPATGAALAYSIAKRDDTTGGLTFDRLVSARSVCIRGYYDRIDQYRGISPISAALNPYRDVYEGFDYALAKLKIAQLFGLIFYRESVEGFGDPAAAPTSDEDGDGVAESRYEVDLSRGQFALDLDPGDKAEFLEASTPPSETVDFLRLIIHVALKALDIPFSFFDESFTNFYGSRGGLIQYLKSCVNKIADLQELLDDLTRWRLGLAVADSELELPRSFPFEQLRWQWVPDGVPWWDPVKEVTGHSMAIAAGLDSPQRVCQMAGTDFYDNVDAIAEAKQYAESKGVVLTLPAVKVVLGEGAMASSGKPTEGTSDDDE